MINHELVIASGNEINEKVHESIEESDKEANNIISPLSLFQLFFTDEQLHLIVKNSNIYELVKSRESGQVWTPLTLSELKVWLGLIIYMGVHHINAIEDLWNQDNKIANHEIKRFISLYSFQQIKQFFHISIPGQLHSN
ncbi:11896_t:CDS:2 [Dentiscutata heterogama]|uniref:11896_t:CDS:1 n=1 Tax=Dentiscutata heterogama TaxID=1316150 RepID=A0ACA9JYY1_9GLOM|nr:11896_t:CDS:2 [Dentiscutata heterogama]